MKTYLLALGTDNSNVEELVVCNFPFNGINKIKRDEFINYKNSICNIGITDNLDLVGMSGELSRYTHYDVNTMKLQKKAYVVIAESENYQGKVYFITDGFEDPKWVSVQELEKLIQKNGHAMANSKITSDYRVEAIKGEFDNVDFKEYAIEYRKYLKTRR